MFFLSGFLTQRDEYECWVGVGGGETLQGRQVGPGPGRSYGKLVPRLQQLTAQCGCLGKERGQRPRTLGLEVCTGAVG